MAFAYVLDPTNQFQNRAGVNNVHGFFKVYINDTDDIAVTYKDFNGTLNPERIDIDNNGRAVIIADSSRPYRVEMYEPNGDLVFTQYPVWTLASGGGMSMVNVESTDGSVSVQKTSAGGLTTYDLSVDSDDDSRYLDWIKCSWYDLVDGAYVPRYAAGTMSVGAKGVNLAATMLYHVTATVRANKTGERSPFYDNIGVHFSLFDGENTVEVQNFTRIVDHSLGLSQDFTVDADIMVGSLDSQLVVTIDGAESGITFNLMSVEAHRIYSGVPKIPEGIASESWVDDNYQKKLVAGEGITIDPTTNEISADAQPQVQADWSQTNPESASFIKNKPNLATVATTGSYNDLNGKPNLASVATSGSYDDLSNKPSIPAAQVQSDWGQHNTQAVDYIKNKPALAAVATSGSYNDLSDKPDIPSQQEQANWTEQDSSKPSYIKNKPNLSSVATSGDYNDLSNKPSIPAAQVQSDWGQTNNQAVDYIKNKPNLASVATSGSYNDLSDKPTIPQGVPSYSATEEGKVLGVVDNSGTPALDWVEQSGGTQEQADWTEQDSSAPDYIKNKPNLASVATSGSYNDLSDKPSIPAAQVQSDWSQSNNQAVDFIKNKPNLASVATSGSYNDLSDKPSIPAAQVQSDWNQSNSSAVDYIKNKPSIPAAQVQSDWSQSDNTQVDFIKNKPNLASVATSGSYDDLSNKPSIPAAQVQSDWDQSNSSAVDYIKNKPSIPVIPQMKNLVAGSNVTITETANGIEIASTGGGGTQVQSDWTEQDSADPSYIQNKPNLASVATSGSYNDLSDKPSIPAAQVQSDWSQSDNTQVDYIKHKPNLASVATSGSYNDLSNKPTIPAAPVQSNWNESDSSSLAYIQNKPNLASVATTGSYNDLSNKPSIPAAQVQSDWSQSDNAAVDYIKNKPAIPGVAVESNSFTLTDSSDDKIEVDYTPTIVTQSDLHVSNENVTLFDSGVGYTYIHLDNAWNYPAGTTVRIVLHSDVVTYINSPIQISENPSGNPFTKIGEIARTPDNKILAGTYEFTTEATASEYYIRLVTTGPAAELTELGVGDFDVYVNPVDTRKTTIPAEYVAGSGISITTNSDGTKTISLDIPVADTEAF